MVSPFLERLARGPILCDGAMGTMLYAKGIEFDECVSRANLLHPELVLSIHQDYILAGAEIIETNTYDANRFKLTPHDAMPLLREINIAGVRLARQAAESTGRQIFVAASIGPIGAPLAPVGHLSQYEAYTIFREQIRALLEGQPDVLIFETFGDLKEIEVAIRTARELTDLPAIAQMTFMNEGTTPVGYLPEQVARTLMNLPVEVVGANCSVGPARILPVIETMIAARDERGERPLYFSAQPNAGFPEAKGGRIFYPATPEYFGDYAMKFAEAGVMVIGGCCGTTPNHVRAMRIGLDAQAKIARRKTPILVGESRRDKPVRAPEPFSQLQRKIEAGRFIVGVELDPPKGFDVEPVLANARVLKEAGADTVNIADTPRAQMRMSAWAIAHLVQTEVNIESVLHFPVRGRNLLRVQGDLLAAHALRVRNVFVVMGDPTAIGDYPAANDTFDLAPSGLTKLIKKHFNRGVDQAGSSIGAPCSFTVGVACDPGTQDVAREIKTLKKKVDAGADFALTQAIFEPDVLRNFIKRYEDEYGKLELPLFIGLLPLASSRHAEFIHNEVPGISLPDEIRERMRRSGDQGGQEGIRIAQEILLQVRQIARGVYMMPPFGRYERVADLLEILEAEKIKA